MATKTTVLLLDDLESPKEKPADETVVFSLDGTVYEIDLTKANAKGLREKLAPYIAKARPRKPTVVRSSGVGSAARKRSRTADNALIRAWAKEQGMAVSVRGRIGGEVIKAYNAANN